MCTRKKYLQASKNQKSICTFSQTSLAAPFHMSDDANRKKLPSQDSRLDPRLAGLFAADEAEQAKEMEDAKAKAKANGKEFKP
jgi:hypothetical protein